MGFNSGDKVNCSAWTQVGFMSVYFHVTDILSTPCVVGHESILKERNDTKSVGRDKEYSNMNIG